MSVDIDRLQELCDTATPLPWKLWAMDVLHDPVGTSNLDDAMFVAKTHDPHRGLKTFNAMFIAETRNAMPDLLAELRELRAMRDKVYAMFPVTPWDDGPITADVCERLGMHVSYRGERFNRWESHDLNVSLRVFSDAEYAKQFREHGDPITAGQLACLVAARRSR